jgi:hypothetical protein
MKLFNEPRKTSLGSFTGSGTQSRLETLLLWSKYLEKKWEIRAFMLVQTDETDIR